MIKASIINFELWENNLALVWVDDKCYWLTRSPVRTHHTRRLKDAGRPSRLCATYLEAKGNTFCTTHHQLTGLSQEDNGYNMRPKKLQFFLLPFLEFIFPLCISYFLSNLIFSFLNIIFWLLNLILSLKSHIFHQISYFCS